MLKAAVDGACVPSCCASLRSARAMLEQTDGGLGFETQHTNASHSSLSEQSVLATMVLAQVGVFLPWANPGAGWRPVKALPDSLCSDRSPPGRRAASSGAYRPTRCDGCTATGGYS